MTKFYTMKIILVLFLLPIVATSQGITHFDWSAKSIEINSVEMEVTDQVSKKQIFKGYKDAAINIETGVYKGSPDGHHITIKLAGYLEIVRGTVRDFKYQVEDGVTTVSYGVIDDEKYAYIILGMNSAKIDRIIVSCTPNLRAKVMKKLTFILTGLDIKEINK